MKQLQYERCLICDENSVQTVVILREMRYLNPMDICKFRREECSHVICQRPVNLVELPSWISSLQFLVLKPNTSLDDLRF